MALEELEQERALLKDQIVRLTLIIAAPEMTPVRILEHDAPGREFLNELERQLEEKETRLRELDGQIDQVNTPLNRFRQQCYEDRWIIRLCAGVSLFAAILLPALSLPGWLEALGLLAAPAAIAWAVWSSSPPK